MLSENLNLQELDKQVELRQAYRLNTMSITLTQGKYDYEGCFHFYTDHWRILELNLYPTVGKWRTSCTLWGLGSTEIRELKQQRF